MMGSDRRQAYKIHEGWTFWITLSIITFFVVFLLPSVPLLSVFLAVLVLVVGKVYFIRRPFTERDIINSVIVVLVSGGLYTILSLRFFATLPLLNLVAAAVLLDVILSVWYIFSTIGRIVIFRWTVSGRRLSVVVQSFVAALVVTMVVFWMFGSAGVFVYPVYMILGIFVKPWMGRGFFPVITAGIVFVKLFGMALL